MLLTLLLLLLFALSEVTFDSRKSALKQQKQKRAERLLWPYIPPCDKKKKKLKVGPHEGTCCRNMFLQNVAGTKSRYVHTDVTCCRAKFLQNLPLQHVPWSSTSWTPCDMLQGQILHKFHVARVKKCQRTREDVSLQHVPETRPGNFFTSVPTLLHGPATCPCYTALQHVPSVCT